jgi:hypothetical protein
VKNFAMKTDWPVRGNAIAKIALGGAGAAAIAFLLYFIGTMGHSPPSFVMITIAYPGAYALTGLLELVTNVPFDRFSARWDALAGWQRGVFGLLVAMAALGTMMFGMVMIFGPDDV